MKDKVRNLFKVTTKGCGTFYVVSSSWDKAEQSVTSVLNEQEYGYSGDRMVTDIEFLRCEVFDHNGKRFLSGANNVNLFIVTED